MVDIVTSFIPRGPNRPGEVLEAVEFIVVHYTGDFNPGHDAKWIRDYFATERPDPSSAHYVVDDKRVVACVPENEVAYHSGSEYHNYRSIGAEWCVNVGQNGGQTYKNAVGLFGDLCRRNPKAKLIRHSDVISTECPGMFTSDEIATRIFNRPTEAVKAWATFQRDVRIAAGAGAIALAQAVRDVR